MSQQAKLVDDDRRHGCDWLTWTMPYRESRLAANLSHPQQLGNDA